MCSSDLEVMKFGSILRGQLSSLDKDFSSKKINALTYSDSVLKVVNEYKTKVSQYIFENPRSAAAYFTLFQKVNGLLIFDPYTKEDYRAYGAVATSWDTFYPESERTKQIKEIALGALRQKKAENNPGISFDSIPEQNRIEIVLPDIKGKEIKLSDMTGKLVLLDFTAYETDYSGPYNMNLAKLYDKYKDKGLEIFQISLDSDENFWKVTGSNLPWITVRDKDSVYSKYARSYNVTSLPALFIIGRDGSIIERVQDVKNLDETIKKLL